MQFIAHDNEFRLPYLNTTMSYLQNKNEYFIKQYIKIE